MINKKIKSMGNWMKNKILENNKIISYNYINYWLSTSCIPLSQSSSHRIPPLKLIIS